MRTSTRSAVACEGRFIGEFMIKKDCMLTLNLVVFVKRPLAVAISMHTMLMFPILTIHDTFKGVLSCNLITRVRLELVAFCH